MSLGALRETTGEKAGRERDWGNRKMLNTKSNL
jgi:hypothetical protein